MQSKREVIWWALGTIREAYEKVVKEEAGRLGIVRENLRKSTDFLRANLCAGRWNERSHFVVCLPALQQFFSGGLYLVGIDGEEARQLVVCKSVERGMNGRAPHANQKDGSLHERDNNYSAVEVGHLRRGQRPFKVVRPKMNGHRSEVLREGADDLTVRAEEIATLKACINVDHIDKCWGPPLVDAYWYAFSQAN